MKNITFLLFTLIYGFVYCQNETNRGYKVSVGDPLPALEMNMINGEVWTNKNLENKVVVIKFTGSWCSVCRREMPELEERELAKIYVRRGLKPQTAAEVARQLHEHDALAAHARDELGINEFTAARPLQAAGASALSFIIGGLLPLLLVFLFEPSDLYWAEYIFSISFLALLGGISAKIGGSSIFKAISRVVIWGTISMCLSALIGTWVQV